MNVNITELRQNLPTYLKRVQKGERIKVTSHGKIIAELVPPTATEDEAAHARKMLRDSIVWIDDSLEPADPVEDWEVNQ
jgi:prevent-host-death family protein